MLSYVHYAPCTTKKETPEHKKGTYLKRIIWQAGQWTPLSQNTFSVLPNGIKGGFIVRCISLCLYQHTWYPKNHLTDLTIWTTSSSCRTWSLPTLIGWCLALVPHTSAYLKNVLMGCPSKLSLTWAHWWWSDGSCCRSPPQCTWPNNYHRLPILKFEGFPTIFFFSTS